MLSRAELEKFARLSHQWWDTNGAFKYLHCMNRPRIRYINERTQELRLKLKPKIKKGSVVDVGCGGGLATEGLARLGQFQRVVGIDAARENIQMAQLHSQMDPLVDSKVEYRQMTAEQLVGERFDTVVSLEVIEHVADPVCFVKSLVELANPGGLIFISTMNRTALSWLVDIAVPEYLMGWVPRGTHDHGKFLDPQRELGPMLAACGAQVLEIKGLVMNPLTDQCHLVDKDCGLLRNAGVQANYILVAKVMK